MNRGVDGEKLIISEFVRSFVDVQVCKERKCYWYQIGGSRGCSRDSCRSHYPEGLR